MTSKRLVLSVPVLAVIGAVTATLLVSGCGQNPVSKRNYAVSKDNYDKIVVGMSEDDVKKILGEPAQSVSASASKTSMAHRPT